MNDLIVLMEICAGGAAGCALVLLWLSRKESNRIMKEWFENEFPCNLKIAQVPPPDAWIPVAKKGRGRPRKVCDTSQTDK